jgi:hypothetical protein
MRRKKGIFYTLSVLIVILLVLIIFSNRMLVLNKDEAFNLGRAKILVMDTFVGDFDHYYAKNILETATKPALIKLTSGMPLPIADSDLVDLMVTGDNGVVEMNELYSTDNNLQQSLGTLTFQPDRAAFSYYIDDVKQIDLTTMVISFIAEYHFTAFNTTWEKTGKQINITVPIYSLWHPAYSAYIDTDWVEDPAPADCFLDQIFSDASACDEVWNMMPPP